jgi:hypothetical protein
MRFAREGFMRANGGDYPRKIECFTDMNCNIFSMPDVQ